jgi:serine/threonine protein phosphatase 1
MAIMNSSMPVSWPLLRRFARNTRGRDLIVGDIHGCFTKLQAALSAVGFDPEDGDRLFSVGDLVDRGPDSEVALDWLASPWFFAVRGNHEDMAVRWPNGRMDAAKYATNGGAWNIGNPPARRLEIADAFRSLPLAIEIETPGGLVGIVHADCPLGSWPAFKAVLENPSDFSGSHDVVNCCMWSRDRIALDDRSGVSGVRALVVGHTPLPGVQVLGNVFHIDTAGWHPSGAGFTLLDAASLESVTVRLEAAA